MHLHVVSFNVPFPADYGGVIDVYHRLCALSDAGVRVHLHCYTYGREAARQLEQICEEVCYYPRATGWRSQLDRRPYIAASRRSSALIERLRQDDYPILLEGLHDCYVLEQLAGCGRKISVRAHNVEHDYYRSLAKVEATVWKHLFFNIESRKLKRYESVLKRASSVLAISEKDASHFRQLGCPNVVLLPPSHGHLRVTSQKGRGGYVLYQGNLAVPENRNAVNYLLDNLFDKSSFPFVVAGRNPDEVLRQRIAPLSNVRLEANPDDETMHRLLRDAQVNLLYTEQATGVKLKLMNALFEGRHCLVNSLMVAGTGIEKLCHVADTPEEMRQQLSILMETDFAESDISLRQQQLPTDRLTDDLLHIIL